MHPDGASELISYGVLNLTHHASHEFPQALVPGKRIAARVVLDQAAYRVPAGHRLRVAVSTAYWPMIWPSPEAASLEIAAATLSLPVRPLAERQRDRVRAAGRRHALGDRHDPAERIPNAMSTATRKTGVTTLRIFDDFGEVRDRDHGLVNGSMVRETWTIDPADPLSARGETHWSQTLSRNDWSVSTETSAEMVCDAQNFRLKAQIKAFEGGELVFERHFEEEVPRSHL